MVFFFLSKESLFVFNSDGETAPIDFFVTFTSFPPLFMIIYPLYPFLVLTFGLGFGKIRHMSKLEYEETPINKTRVVYNGKEITIRKVFNFIKGKVSSIFNNIKNKVVKPHKKSKKPTKAEREIAKNERNRAIMGIGQLLVVVSIAYSTAVIFIGVDSMASKIALLPQVVFASFILLKAFSRLYK